MLGDIVFEAFGVLAEGVLDAFLWFPDVSRRWVGRLVAALLVTVGLAAYAAGVGGGFGLAVAAVGALALTYDAARVLLGRRRSP